MRKFSVFLIVFFTIVGGGIYLVESERPGTISGALRSAGVDQLHAPVAPPAPPAGPARAHVSIKTEPATAELEINGVAHGNAPAELDLPINMKISLRVRREGYAPERREFTVTGPKEILVKLKKNAISPQGPPLRK
jgi:hypothetical protein